MKPGELIQETYYITESLGNGGYGLVYLAEKRIKSSNKIVGEIKYALKFLTNHEQTGIEVDKFEKEIASLVKTGSHINIISIHDAFICEIYKLPVIVTDYANGGSLFKKTFSFNQSIKIIKEVLTGLEHLHGIPIIHRDIKLGNILLKDGMACISDFGLARDLNKTQTTTGLGGSTDYYSPELAKAVSKRDSSFNRTEHEDLWATAVTFYQLLTNTLPFNYPNPLIFKRESLPENFPCELIIFFDRAFHKTRKKRFQSAKQMRDELEKLLSIEAKYQAKIEQIIIESDIEKSKSQKVLEETLSKLDDLSIELELEQKNIQLIAKEKLTIEKKLSTESINTKNLSNKILTLQNDLQTLRSLGEVKTTENENQKKQFQELEVQLQKSVNESKTKITSLQRLKKAKTLENEALKMQIRGFEDQLKNTQFEKERNYATSEFEISSVPKPLINHNSENLTSSNQEQIQMLRSGINLAKEGKRAEARQMLFKVTAIEPESQTAWLWLASISELAEEQAVFLKNALNANSENKRALEWIEQTQKKLSKKFVRRGINASHDNQKEFAIQCFLQAIVHDEQNEMAWLWLASSTDSVDEKCSHLQKVLNINPENETALSSMKSVKNQIARPFLKKASSAAISGDHELARQNLDEVMKYAPDLEEAWVLKAFLTTDFYEKISCYEKAVQINPKYNPAYTALLQFQPHLKGQVNDKNKSPLTAKIENESDVLKEFLQKIGNGHRVVIPPSIKMDTILSAIQVKQNSTYQANIAIESFPREEFNNSGYSISRKTNPALSRRNVYLPIEVSEEERPFHNDAYRFAHLIVSEIKLYNEQKVKEGRDGSDLYDRLREAIDRSREMYDKRVQPPVASKFDYFHYELVNTLAEGDDIKLGGSYPGVNHLVESENKLNLIGLYKRFI